jgi:hypothetical protein
MARLLQRLFGYFTFSQCPLVVQATADTEAVDFRASPDISVGGHAFTAVFWLACIVSYSVLVTFQWATAPDVDTFLQTASAGLGPVTVHVHASCTRRPRCGDITVTADYSGVAACAHLPRTSVTVPAADEMGAPIALALCFTGEHVYSSNTRGPLAVPGVLVDFASVDMFGEGGDPAGNGSAPAPYAGTRAFRAAKYGYGGTPAPGGAAGDIAAGIVRVTGAGGFDRTVVMETWQVKSLIVGQAAHERYGAVDGVRPYSVAVQYEGRRPSHRATLVVALAPFGDVTATTQKAAQFTVYGLMALLAGCCGACFMVNAAMPHAVMPLVRRCAPGPAEVDRRARRREAARSAPDAVPMDELLVQLAPPPERAAALEEL